MKRNPVLLMAALVAAIACGDNSTPNNIPRHHPGAAAVDSVKSPAWVVDQYFEWTQFPDVHKYLTGEMAAKFDTIKPMGEGVPLEVDVGRRLIRQSDTDAIFATTIRGSKLVTDYYSFLKKEGGVWKIANIRSASFNPAYYQLTDSLMGGARLKDAPATLVGILRLTVSSDSFIKRYFEAHRAGMTAIVSRFDAPDAAGLKFVDIGDSVSIVARRAGKQPGIHDELRRMLDTLYLSTVFRQPANPGCTFLRIGGAGKLQVGYLYAPKGCAVPTMHPDGFFYIGHLADDWYEFKAG